MNRRQADLGVGVLVVAILLSGGVLTWNARFGPRARDGMGSMMGSSMDAVHGTDPLVYAIGTLFAAGVVGVLYLVVRNDVPPKAATEPADSASAGPPEDRAIETAESMPDGPQDPAEPTPQEGAQVETPQEGSPAEPGSLPRQRVLDLLPEDERRVLDPVLTSPGLTQIELRDRADFSKSKVSQTVSDLEQRGLLARERQGRTYRVYPSDELQDPSEGADQQQSASGDH